MRFTFHCEWCDTTLAREFPAHPDGYVDVPTVFCARDLRKMIATALRDPEPTAVPPLPEAAP